LRPACESLEGGGIFQGREHKIGFLKKPAEILVLPHIS